ncbi:DoxX protein [Chryseobacterium taichungense]|uniref:DoxX protein n=1 Tax=Chryseobacterium taichungense TaxID=295069 RepID=A0A1H7VVN3_9FLAO|nr:DoxX family membrane protein [Chryseobacterium taichungense]SEM12875.1 DoxX protein [Chryseobacterium taichungense]
MRFEKLRTNTFNQWIIIHLRYLLGFAFFPSGLVKVMGERFTRVSTSEPIGYFFEALYQSGFYWNFLGLTQVIAGILLMTQRFATLGALVFLAILSNIWIITLSLSFQGTWIITSLMMIAILVLLIWDKHKILPLLSYNKSYLVEQYSDPDRLWIISGSIYAICFISLQLLGPANANVFTRWFSLFLGVVILITFFTSNIMAYRKRKLLLNN